MPPLRAGRRPTGMRAASDAIAPVLRLRIREGPIGGHIGRCSEWHAANEDTDVRHPVYSRSRNTSWCSFLIAR